MQNLCGQRSTSKSRSRGPQSKQSGRSSRFARASSLSAVARTSGGNCIKVQYAHVGICFAGGEADELDKISGNSLKWSGIDDNILDGESLVQMYLATLQ